MHFFDSHCHFDFPVFDIDRELIWRESNALGITHLIIPGVAPEQWPIAASVARRHQNIYLGAGLHPYWINKYLTTDKVSQHLAEFRQCLEAAIILPRCVAVGECGLDATIETPMHLQQTILDIHLQFAQETLLPLIIHCRKAHNELLVQLKRYKLPAGGVIHGFSGSYELAASYWNMGFHLGIGGTITYERANKTRQAVKQLPLAAILLETDAPDMPISGQQGERNSPVNIIAVAQALADLRDETLKKIATQTTLNSHTLFKINN